MPIVEPVSSIESDKMKSCSSKKKHTTFERFFPDVFFLLVDDLPSQSLQLTSNPLESEDFKVPSSTITSSDDTGTFDKQEKERLCSTIRKIFHQKHRLFIIILITIATLSIISFLIFFCFFLIQKPNVHHSPSSLTNNSGKSQIQSNYSSIYSF